MTVRPIQNAVYGQFKVAANTHPLQITNAATNGSGYLSAGDGDRTFAAEISDSVTAATQVVLIFGSDNAQLKKAAVDAYTQAKTAAPAATIIAVGPPAYTATPDPALLQVRDQDQAAAAQAGIIFIDPIHDQWIMGQADQLIGPDGRPPQRAGTALPAKQNGRSPPHSLRNPNASLIRKGW